MDREYRTIERNVETLREEKHHGNYSFPIYADRAFLAQYENKTVMCHWHEELEFTVVTKGKLEYRVNDKTYILRKGDGIVANANALHQVRSIDDKDADYLFVIMNPKIVYGHENSTIDQRYTSTFSSEPELDGVYLNKDVPWQKTAIDLITDIERLYREMPACYEIYIKSRACDLWAELYKNLMGSPANEVSRDFNAFIIVKEMLSFIHASYAEKLSLEDIARAGQVSKGECCRIFKKTLRQSPFSYLHSYRVQRSLPLLAKSGSSITEIAGEVGFSGASYYSEVFRKYMGCSPREYRLYINSDERAIV